MDRLPRYGVYPHIPAFLPQQSAIQIVARIIMISNTVAVGREIRMRMQIAIHFVKEIGHIRIMNYDAVDWIVETIIIGLFRFIILIASTGNHKNQNGHSRNKSEKTDCLHFNSFFTIPTI